MPMYLDKPSQSLDISGYDFDYDYPDGLDLRPTSQLHEKIKRAILQRAMESNNEMSKRNDSWKDIDRTLTAYIPETKKTKAKDKGDQTPPIIVPVSYATLETLLTYLMAAFVQDPIFRYQGTGPEDTIGAKILERVIYMQCLRSGVGLQLHTMFRDSLSYGFGAAAPVWFVEKGKRTVKKELGFFSQFAQKFLRTGWERTTEEATLFEGNRLENISPNSYLPDPNYSIHEVQRGEFAGWVDKGNYVSLLEEEIGGEDGSVFNVRYLKAVRGTSGLSKYGRGPGLQKFRERESQASVIGITTNPIDIIYMYINIIPYDWGLSDVDTPEKWLFGLAADEIVIKAEPLGLDHNKIPIVTCAPDFDGYSLTPTSRLEISYGLQQTIDFMINSHVANVRKAINDVIIVDPMLVNVNDLRTGEPGKIVRTRRQMWGKGVDNVVKQLEVSDVTRGHVRDAMYLTEMIQRVTGAVDIIGGVRRSGGERVSATEARDVRSSALSRLEKAAKIISLQAMQGIAHMFASHTQQLMEEEMYVNLTGGMLEDLEKGYESRKMVKPSDLIVDYDVIPHDGTMPGGEPADLWIQLFQVLVGNPEIAEQFDTIRIFKHMARQLGARNVEEFVKQGGTMKTIVRPDEEVAREVEKGNLMSPIEEGML